MEMIEAQDETETGTGTETKGKSYLRQSVDVDPEDIQGEFIRVSTDIQQWGFRYASAEAEHKRASNRLDIVEAEAAERIRAEYADTKITEKRIDQLILLDPEVQKAMDDEVTALHRKSRVRATVDAVRAKKESIISLGAHIRAEQEPHLKEKR